MRARNPSLLTSAAAATARTDVGEIPTNRPLTRCAAWGFHLREVLGEVHLWHGAQDRFVPVEHARVVAATLPRCRARFDADDGHFFFRRRLEDVLGALVAAFGH